jgi:hypothetical protein
MEVTLRTVNGDFPDGWRDKPEREKPSVFICDNLDWALDRVLHYFPEASEALCWATQDHLHDLGMGRGFNEFVSLASTRAEILAEAQMQRVCWLHFAADVWDEWNPNVGEQS